MNRKEEELLFSMILHPKVRKSVVELSSLKPGDFNTEFGKWVYKRLIVPSAKGKSDEKLDYKQFSTALKLDDDFFDEEVKNQVSSFGKEFYRSLATRTKRRDVISDGGVAIEMANDLHSQRQLVDVSRVILEGRNSNTSARKTMEAAHEALGRAVDEQRGATDYELYDFLPSFRERNDTKEDETSSIVFRFRDEVLQEAFPYGIRSQQMFGICGDTGVGKSVMADNIAIDAIKQGDLNVLLIKTENDYVETSSRLDSIFTGIDYDKIYRGNLDEGEVDEIVKDYSQFCYDHSSRLFVAQVTPKKYTANTIIAIIEHIEREHSIKIHMVINDSPEHQEGINHYKEFWRQKAEPYYDNKRLVKEYDLIKVSTIQRKVDHNRLFNKKKSKKSKDDYVVPTPEQAAGSVEIPRILDYMITLIKPTPRDKIVGGFKAFVTKSRGAAEFDDVILFERDEKNLRMHASRYPDMSVVEDEFKEEREDIENKVNESRGFTQKLDVEREDGGRVKKVDPKSRMGKSGYETKTVYSFDKGSSNE